MASSAMLTMPKVKQTAEFFQPGYAAFIRIDEIGECVLAPAYCQGYSDITGMLTLQWSKEAASKCSVPPPGRQVRCHIVYKGVLYSIQGTVRDLSNGPLPLVYIEAPEMCSAVTLRKDQRYAVLGCIRIGQLSDDDLYCMPGFEEMNISRNGLGACVPGFKWQLHTSRVFCLKVLAAKNGSPILELPSLELGGTMTLRRRSHPTPDGRTFIGCDFQTLRGRGSMVLESWLSTYMSQLLEV